MKNGEAGMKVEAVINVQDREWNVKWNGDELYRLNEANGEVDGDHGGVRARVVQVRQNGLGLWSAWERTKWRAGGCLRHGGKWNEGTARHGERRDGGK